MGTQEKEAAGTGQAHHNDTCIYSKGINCCFFGGLHVVTTRTQAADEAQAKKTPGGCDNDDHMPHRTSSTDIWFDDVDPALLRESAATVSAPASARDPSKLVTGTFAGFVLENTTV